MSVRSRLFKFFFLLQIKKVREKVRLERLSLRG